MRRLWVILGVAAVLFLVIGVGAFFYLLSLPIGGLPQPAYTMTVSPSPFWYNEEEMETVSLVSTPKAPYTVIVPFQYSSLNTTARAFPAENFVVLDDEGIRVVNAMGRTVFPLTNTRDFVMIVDYHDGTAVVWRWQESGEREIGAINAQGEEIIPLANMAVSESAVQTGSFV